MGEIIIPGQSEKKAEIVLPESVKPVSVSPFKKPTDDDQKKIAALEVDKLIGRIRVPDIYFWVDYDDNDKPVQMTAAFKYFSKKCGELLFGEMLSIDSEWSKRTRTSFEKLLMGKMVDTLDVLVHHGDRILDTRGNINYTTLNDAEAERFWLDKNWKNNVDAFHKVVRVKAINVAKARELGLI